MGRKRLFALAAVVVAGAAVAVALWLRAPAVRPAAAPPAQAAARPAEITLPAKIRAQHLVAVTSQIAGDIQAFLVDVGQEVYEGEVLARISNQGLETARELAAAASEAAQARVNKAESAIIAARLEASRARADAVRSRSEFERADKTLRRQQMLHGQGATPRLVYEKAERDFESAQTEFRSLDALARQAEERITLLVQEREAAKKILDEKSRDLEQAQAQLQAAEILSPVSGLVVERKGEAGKPQEPGAAIFQIAVDLAELEATFEPEPPVLQRIKLGDPVLVLIPDLPGEGFTGTLKEANPNQAIAAFTSTNPAVKPGMPAQVRIRWVQ